MENSTPTAEWMRAYQKAVNADPEMGVIGDWFSTDFKISFEGIDFLISVREGKIVEIEQNPRFDRPAAFTLRAPMSVWNKFISPKPPPLYHDFFAMLMRVDDFQLDGDVAEYAKMPLVSPGHKGDTLAYRKIMGLEEDSVCLL